MVHDLQVGGVQYANISGHLVATTDLDNVARYLPTKWQTKKKMQPALKTHLLRPNHAKQPQQRR
jgi:hypothetical protein